jgi:S1-C subfamily serine protease
LVVWFMSLLLVSTPAEPLGSTHLSKERQAAALTATVRVSNVTMKVDGSGVIVGKKGACVYILTACHVVERADRLEVTTFSPDSLPRPTRVYRAARVVARANDMRDLALVRVLTDEPIPGSLSLCPSRLVPEGSGFTAVAVGCADGGAPIGSVCHVNGKVLARREGQGKAAYFWETDQKQQEGCSGGPLVDGEGHVLGVCSGTNRERSYFCHPTEIRAFLQANGFEWLP